MADGEKDGGDAPNAAHGPGPFNSPCLTARNTICPIRHAISVISFAHRRRSVRSAHANGTKTPKTDPLITARLGLFDNEVEAAKARDRKAYELAGPFAYLNFPDEIEP